jgi:hypothetical protein
MASGNEHCMTLLQQIFTWTQGLPTWQSDAVSRLLRNKISTGPDKDKAEQRSRVLTRKLEVVDEVGTPAPALLIEAVESKLLTAAGAGDEAA